MRAWAGLALLLTGAAAAPAAEAPAWSRARGAVTARYTGGSDYESGSLTARASAPLSPALAAYARLQGSRDSAYDWNASGILGLERELGTEWLGWAGAGYSGGRAEDPGRSTASFLLETGLGRPVLRWWADASYRLAAGETGLPPSYRSDERRPASSLGPAPSRHDGRREPAAYAPSVRGDRFSLHELSVYIGSPVFPVWRGVSADAGAAGWTDTDGARGWNASLELSVVLAPGWALLLGGLADALGGRSAQAYGTAGMRWSFGPSRG